MANGVAGRILQVYKNGTPLLRVKLSKASDLIDVTNSETSDAYGAGVTKYCNGADRNGIQTLKH